MRRYAKEFKHEAIRRLGTRGDTTVAEIASDLGLSNGTLYRWRKELGVAPKPSINSVSLEVEARRQRLEIAQLHNENLTLRKLVAFFVRELDL